MRTVLVAECAGSCCKDAPFPNWGDRTKLIPSETPGMFTCEHSMSDGKCAIYETRPQFCREEPFGYPCWRCGGTGVEV